ncbi:fluoride efflux transporter CrcB [Thalassoglobus sp. JC818]|uniref:fluoride efflux transporter CrcB n=1 Tax=Thalassoglobus sp. JC818 TaxID=3232136 RepID=UPI00345ABD41
MQWLAVALGGSLGAMLRFALSQWVVRRFPVGTLVVNVVGCFLIGLLISLAVKTKWPGPTMQCFLIGGFLGSLTTFSTFAYQTFELSAEESLSWGMLNLFSNLVLGLALVWLGIVTGEAIAATFESSN